MSEAVRLSESSVRASTRRRPAARDAVFVVANETKRLLIADDNRDWADGLAVLLGERGFSVKTAYDGREALEAAREFQPHIVMLDVWMPNMTGFEAGRVFSRHPSETRPVMIAVTAWPEESGKARAVTVGFDHYLSKSADSSHILALLESLTA